MNNQINTSFNNMNMNANRNFNNPSNKPDETRRLILSILGLAILIAAVIGISFAAYRATIVTKNPNVLTTGSVTVSYTEANSAINMKNAMPVSDAIGKSMEDNSFAFAITTKAKQNTTVPYNISISKGSDNTLDDTYIKVYLLKENKPVVGPITLAELSDYTKRNNSKLLYSTSDNFENTNERINTHYTLKLWVDSSFEVGANSSKTFSAKVNVDAGVMDEN